MISIQKIQPTSSIVVHGIGSTTEDMLMLHFESSKRSGGGEVKKVSIERDRDLAVIEFVDRSSKLFRIWVLEMEKNHCGFVLL